MKRENLVRVFAGSFVFVSALLGYLHSKYWLFFTMFVGLNLLQYGFTNWCLLEKIMAKLGIEE
jgi:hypothetical protein